MYQRDGYTCQNCGAKGGHRGDAELHAHHVVPISDGGSHSTSNLTTYCKACHDVIHGNRQAPAARSDSGTASDNAHRSLVAFAILIGALIVAFAASRGGDLGFVLGVLFVLTVVLTIAWAALTEERSSQ